MTRSQVVVMCLKGEGAVLKNREIMGNKPAEAADGTIRKMFAESMVKTRLGSDTTETQKKKSHSSSLNLRSTNS